MRSYNAVICVRTHTQTRARTHTRSIKQTALLTYFLHSNTDGKGPPPRSLPPSPAARKNENQTKLKPWNKYGSTGVNDGPASLPLKPLPAAETRPPGADRRSPRACSSVQAPPSVSDLREEKSHSLHLFFFFLPPDTSAKSCLPAWRMNPSLTCLK